MSETLDALLHPFAKGLLAPPAPGRGVMLRAEWGSVLDETWRRGLTCVQSFKPDYDRLVENGFTTIDRLDGERYDLGLCLLSKHKAESLSLIAQLWAAVVPGGRIVCAGRIDSGAASVARLVAQAAGGVEILAKYHCKVFWFERSAATPPEIAAWAAAGVLGPVAATGYFSRPGLHSWDKIDRGSALLANHLPADLGGRVADLGAGWGYLSAEVLRRCPGATALDLYEAEGLALEAAAANLGRIETAIVPRYHWHDVRGGLGAQTYDAIIMNPPFHAGKDTAIPIGQRFITVAGAALRPGGRLFLVANRQLPYEHVLKAQFHRHRVLDETGLYKVIEAVR